MDNNKEILLRKIDSLNKIINIQESQLKSNKDYLLKLEKQLIENCK